MGAITGALAGMLDAPAAAPLSILIATARPVAAHACVAVVTEHGWRARATSSARDAVVMFRAEEPDIAIVDADLRDADGTPLPAVLRAATRRRWLPLIVLVASDAGRDAASLGEAGEWYVTKPFSRRVLEAQLRAATRVLAMERELALRDAALERHQARWQEEMAMARDVLRQLMRVDPAVQGRLRHYIAPAEGFSGDIVLAERCPDGRIHLLLADAIGHGLAAALTLMPVVRAFVTMSRKGLALADIIPELNQSLRALLPADRFVAATIAAIHPEGPLVEVWNAGNPAALLFDAAGEAVCRWPSTHLPLGIVDASRMDLGMEATVPPPGAQLLVCSDGLVEATDARGAFFGEAGVLAAARHAAPRARYFTLIDAVRRHLGDARAADDISFVLADCGGREPTRRQSP